MDRLRAFEVFVAVVGRGGFAKAADALDTSPANVTRYVGELEAHLGARLLNRSSRGISLTEAGEALYERARAILAEVAEAEDITSLGAAQARGRLRINAPLSFGVLHLAPLWPQFMAAHPEVELDVSLSDRRVDLVEEGYDMAIRISRGGSTAYVARKLAISRNLICAAPSYLECYGHPTTPEALNGHRCVAYSLSLHPDEWEITDAGGRTETVRLTPVMYANNGDTARVAGVAGQGVIWQPTFLIADDLRTGRLVQLLPAWRVPEIDILAVYPSRRHVPGKVRAMVDFLARAFRDTPPWEC
jgi:DNA-binding transcriptional LysR family regulator